MSQTFKKQGWCNHCQTTVFGERQPGISDGMGCLISVITVGLFLPIFIIWRIADSFQRYRCPHCGTPISGMPKR